MSKYKLVEDFLDNYKEDKIYSCKMQGKVDYYTGPIENKSEINANIEREVISHIHRPYKDNIISDISDVKFEEIPETEYGETSHITATIEITLYKIEATSEDEACEKAEETLRNAGVIDPMTTMIYTKDEEDAVGYWMRLNRVLHNQEKK